MSITTEQKWTTAGLVVGICGAFFGQRFIPVPYVITSAIGFGAGSTASLALLRLAGLLRDGTSRRNVFGAGILTSSALCAGLLIFNTFPDVLTQVPQMPLCQGYSVSLWPFLALGTLAGFLQNRANLLENYFQQEGGVVGPR